MEKTINVLILTAPFGSGHLQVSASLAEEFSKIQNIRVEEYDLYSDEYPLISKTLQKAYLRTYAPIGKDIYRMLYYTSSHAVDETLYAKLLKPLLDFGKESLREKIRDFQPDLIISVFPVTSLYKLLKKELKIPLYTVITDYYANGLWLYKDARRHFVATERISKWGMEKGLSSEQFSLTGIPVHPKFYSRLETSKIYKKYSLSPNLKTLLVSAGTHGVLSGVVEMVAQLLEDRKVQLIVVCGKNEKLFNELKSLPNPSGRLVVLGYTTQMHELLQVSDVMITKPGGISLTEAAIKGVPVLMYKPVYGQEMENANYFSEKKAGIIVSNRTELMGAVFTLFESPALLSQMKENIRKLSQLNSAERITGEILQDVTEITLCEMCKKHHAAPGSDSNAPLISDMPAAMGALYKEAQSIIGLSPKSACALLRLGISQMLQEITGSRVSVSEAANLLIRGGRLPARSAELLADSGLMGPDARVPGVIHECDDREMAEKLVRLTHYLINKAISEPRLARRLTWRLPEGENLGKFLKGNNV